MEIVESKRPTTRLVPGPRKVKYVKVHDAFTPLNMNSVSLTSLSTEGPKAATSITEGETGVEVTLFERKFVIPYANIAFFEVEA